MRDNPADLGPLSGQFPVGGLFGTWLEGDVPTISRSAAAELAATAVAPSGGSRAPLWDSSRFADRLPADWRDLPNGPEVVVTGQQPGYFGGPLLTLYKIATAIVLARDLTAQGRPTVPVFWSGDDDDDLVEALAPVGWDPRSGQLLRSPDRDAVRRSARDHRVLAALGPEVWAEPVWAQLTAAGVAEAVPAEVGQVLSGAGAPVERWGAGQAALIQAVFSGTGLVIVRGNDPELHAVAAPFYDRLHGRLPALSALVRARGEQLVAAGYHAQINERSLNRPLFRLSGEQRHPVADSAGIPAAELRPGVMLRSLVQDWLLQPAAVVVGPGEFAYLRQLDPLYEELAVARSPLVPRLFGWVLPTDDGERDIISLVRAAGEADGPSPEALADRVAAVAARAVETVLRTDLQVPEQRAAELAAGRARRFRKGLVSLFHTELGRREQEQLAAVPAWIMPDGQRQERSLGVVSGLGLWGRDLVTASLAAAAEHLAAGRRGRWCEWAWMVPERTVGQ